ncbi:MAG: transcriptional regulator [Geobacteraceae bacterium GWC2_53_11]|nr:MAG: transcriptional regulator [Geobacteraceae bacterium GWC2_53_11]
MFFNEHSPPHFHAEYGEYKAVINIQTLEVMDGKMSRRALELVLDWAELHQAELMEDWDLCRKHIEPHPIEPLQ